MKTEAKKTMGLKVKPVWMTTTMKMARKRLEGSPNRDKQQRPLP